MRYELIPPENLHAVWPEIKPGIERVKEVSSVPWVPEDIFAHIRFKFAALTYAYSDSGKRRGFFVTEVKRIPHSGEVNFHIWVLYADPVDGSDHFADTRGLMNETLDYLDTLARNANATVMSFDGRWGWTRFLGSAFTPTSVRMERKVP